MKFPAKDIITLPNILTYLRLLAVPFFCWMMFDNRYTEYNVFIAFALFMFASITDVIDGAIARKYNLITDLGRVADPIADKLLQVSTMICLAIIGHLHYAFVIVLLLKEFYMVLGGVIVNKVFRSDFVIESNRWGKVGSLVNTAGIIMTFFHLKQYNYLYYIDWAIVGVGCVLAIIAAANYTISFVKYHKAQLADKAISIGESDDIQ